MSGPGITDEIFTLHAGDARDLERLLRRTVGNGPAALTTTITSPPYADLKDYGHPDQLGWGQTYEDYLADCERIFGSIANHTHKEGSLWIVADTFRPERSSSQAVRRLQPLPFDLADRAARSGWVLREVIIWHKNKTLPWSSPGRLRNAFEYILLLVRSKAFKYRIDRLRDVEHLEEWWVKWPERYSPLGKAPTNIWSLPIPTQGSWREPLIAHSCPLPPELVERLILLSTDPGDIVFDPFAGTGSVLAQAERLGRKALGIELRTDYVNAYDQIVRPAVLAQPPSSLARQAAQAEWLNQTIRHLRALKYAKMLMKAAAGLTGADPKAAVVIIRVPPGLPAPFVVTADLSILAEGSSTELTDLLHEMKKLIDRPPLSKYGVHVAVEVRSMDQFADRWSGRRLYLYSNGHTWFTDGRKAVGLALERHLSHVLTGPRPHSTRPIFSNIAVREQPRRLGDETRLIES